jgi:hypothetical protein
MQAELPGIQEARTWIGWGLDDLSGAAAGKVQALFCDAESGDPAWVVLKLGRFGRSVAIPFRDCAAGAGRLWVPYERPQLRSAPAVDPMKPLTREQELTVAAHYGISENVGRGAEVADRPPGAITARSAETAGG